MQVGGDDIRHSPRIFDAANRQVDLWRDFLVELHVAVEQVDHPTHQGLQLRRRLDLLVEQRHLDLEVRFDLDEALDQGPGGALDQDLDGVVGQLQHLHDFAEHADPVEVGLLGILAVGPPLGAETDLLAVHHRLLGGRNRTLPADVEREDPDDVRFVEVVESDGDRQAADELRDQPVLEEVHGLELLEDFRRFLAAVRVDFGAKADLLVADAMLDQSLEAVEGAAADEQDVGGVDLDEVLVWVFAAALGRDVGDGALQDLQQRLLHPLTRDIPRDGRVVGLAGDLVDLVDVDDAALRPRDVEIRRLDQPQQDVLHVLADVAGLGQRRGVGDRERHVDDLRQRLGQQRLAAAGGADEQHIGLLELDIARHLAVGDALVVVVDGNRENALGVVLADDVLVERRADGLRVRDQPALGALGRGGLGVLFQHFLAEVDALIADVDPGTGHQLADLGLVLPTEGTAGVAAAILAFVHLEVLGPSRSGSGRGSGRAVLLPAVLSSRRPSLAAAATSAGRAVLRMMSSMMP